jgi:ABC-2 type transport system permease protein
MRAKHYVLELLSGLLMPIPFFPDWLAGISRWLPFQAIAYVPSSIYLGRFSGADLAAALGLQAAWALVLVGAGALLWKVEARRLTVQGG